MFNFPLLKYKTLVLQSIWRNTIVIFLRIRQFQVTAKLYLRKYSIEPQFFTCFCKAVGTVLTNVLAINPHTYWKSTFFFRSFLKHWEYNVQIFSKQIDMQFYPSSTLHHDVFFQTFWNEQNLIWIQNSC